MTGTSLPTNCCSARSIVPSPPSTTARSALETSASPPLVPCFAASSSESTSWTSAAAAARATWSRAGPIIAAFPAFPCVITAARRTAFASADLGCDPVVDVIRKLGLVALDEMEEDLAVPFRARQAGVYDAGGLATPREGRLRHLPHDPSA